MVSGVNASLSSESFVDKMLQCWSWSAVDASTLVARDRTSGLILPCRFLM